MASKWPLISLIPIINTWNIRQIEDADGIKNLFAWSQVLGFDKQDATCRFMGMFVGTITLHLLSKLAPHCSKQLQKSQHNC